MVFEIGDSAVHLVKIPPSSSSSSSSFSILPSSLLGIIMSVVIHPLQLVTAAHTHLAGHNGAIMAASWSHSDQWLLTGSADRTACVWQLDQPQKPLLTFTTTAHNFKKPTDASLQVI